MVAILELSIWKLVQFELEKNNSRDIKLQQLITRYHIHHKHSNKWANKHETNQQIYLKNKQELEEDTKKSCTIREDYLNEKMQEAKIDSNNKHYKYVSNIILIEYQQQM